MAGEDAFSVEHMSTTQYKNTAMTHNSYRAKTTTLEGAAVRAVTKRSHNTY